MSTITLFRRRDPFWEIDGPAARAKRRRDRIVSVMAFAASLTAVAGAAFAWWVEVGVTAFLHNHMGVG